MKNIYVGFLAGLVAFGLFPTPYAHAVNSGEYAGSVAIGTSYIGVAAPTNGLIVQGNVGIGTTSPDALLSLGGQAAQVVDMVRETTASTAGNDLTIKAGGATSGGTNLNGGNLNLISGISTGTGSSGINFKIYEAGASGSSDNSSTTAMTINGAGNVGIGTTSPLSPLSIVSTLADTQGSVFDIESNPGTAYFSIKRLTSTTLADLLTLLFGADLGSAIRTPLRT
jgi:hypothetical protein